MTTSTVSYATQIQFCRALNIVRSLPDHGALQPTAADKLNLYGLYKQATLGDCTMTRPSSRQMGRYAKWKAWDQRRGIGPVEAQRLYVNFLIELLVEFINRYPDHEQTPSLREALHYIETKEAPTPDAEENLYLDGWNPEEAEKEEYYLAHLGPHHLEPSDLMSSPEQHQQHHYQDYPTPSLATFASNTSTHQDFPDTPDLSPPYRHHHSQKKSHQGASNISGSISISSCYPNLPQHTRYVRPKDFLNGTAMSDTETVDREVAATTASLRITSPTSYPSTYPHSERALESLQTEVAALSEQIDMVRKGMADRDKRDRNLRSWSPWRLVKTVAKHALINTLVLILLFWILWRRRSPVALILVGHVGPKSKKLMRYLLQHVVFWKVTV